MTESLYIVTGASRGMGEAIAAQLLAPGHVVIGISRGSSASLSAVAAARGATLEQWPHDLAAPQGAARALSAWLAAQPAGRFRSAVLINNAALLVTPGPLALADGEALAASVRVGLEAPLMLSQAFLAGTQGRVGDRRILNISSGLGRRAMAGSVAYCAIKAGLDHAARALALEEAEHPQGARIVSLAPGVIDTDMQVQLRGADPSRFPEQARFQNFKDSGALLSSEAAAKLVLAYLARPDFGDTVIADVRDT